MSMRAVVSVAPASEPPMSRRSGALVDSSRMFFSTVVATVDDGSNVVAGEGAGELALAQAVDDLHLRHVTRVAPGVEELAIERQILGQIGEERAQRGALDELGVVVFVGVTIVEPVDVLDEDELPHAQ